MAATTGRVALLTGASSGIGWAVAEHMAAMNYRIILCSRNPNAAAESLARNSANEVVPVATDIADPNAVDQLMAAVDEMGRLDALLLNHGSPLTLPFLDLTDDAWEGHFRLMVLGPLRILRAAVAPFRRSGGGRVVGISSSSVKSPHPGIILSNSLRAALVNALKTIAAELGPDDILCNAVAPGFTDVPATRDRWNRYHAQRTGSTADAVDRETLASIPLRRYARPSDVAALVVFLLSESNGYVTGQHILVDGGVVLAS